MVGFFEKHTALQFVSGTWIADIQGDLPGAGTGGRSVGPKPINLRRIRKSLRPKLRRQLYETSFLGMGIMAGPDLQAFLHATTSVKGFFHAAWRVAFHVLDLITYRQGMQLVNGTALIARLAQSADDLGVQLLVNTPATRLLTEDGAVTGAVLAGPDGETTVRARRGVLLAAGGFPHDVARRRELFPRTPTGQEHWTLAPPETTGDGITLGESAGGAFDTDAGLAGGLVPGVAGALPQRAGRHVPAHRRPGQARPHRRAVHRQALRQRGRRLLPVHQRHDRRRPGRRRGRGLADLRPRLPAPLPVRHVQAVPGTGVALPPVGLPHAGADAGGARDEVRHRPRRAGRHRRRVQRARSRRRGPRVRPWTQRVQPRVGRPRARAQPVPGPDREGPVLRDQGAARQLRHVRGAQGRRVVAGAHGRLGSRSRASTSRAATRPT